MSKPVATRVIEVYKGKWIVQFEGGLNGWVQLGDVFDTREAAEAFRREQLDSAEEDEE